MQLFKHTPFFFLKQISRIVIPSVDIGKRVVKVD